MTISYNDLIALGNVCAYYSEATATVKTEYFCTPQDPTIGITTLGWKVMRVQTDLTTDTGDLVQGKAIQYAGGSPYFGYKATDLAYCKTLTYS